MSHFTNRAVTKFFMVSKRYVYLNTYSFYHSCQFCSDKDTETRPLDSFGCGNEICFIRCCQNMAYIENKHIGNKFLI